MEQMSTPLLLHKQKIFRELLISEVIPLIFDAQNMY